MALPEIQALLDRVKRQQTILGAVTAELHLAERELWQAQANCPHDFTGSAVIYHSDRVRTCPRCALQKSE